MENIDYVSMIVIDKKGNIYGSISALRSLYFNRNITLEPDIEPIWCG